MGSDDPLIRALRDQSPAMTGSEDWLAPLRYKRQRLTALREEIAALTAEANALSEELAEALNIVGKPGRVWHYGRRRSRPFQHGSSVWWAIQVLFEAQAPLVVDELIARIEARAGRSIQKTTLVSNLSRYVSHRDTFTRVAPSTFGLIKE